MLNLYAKLGIRPDAAPADIQAAIKKAAQTQSLPLELLQQCKHHLLIDEQNRNLYNATLSAAYPDILPQLISGSPHSYKRHMINLRTLIRQKRKQKTDYESELRVLYKMAAAYSFICKAYVSQDDFCVILDDIPREVAFSLSYTYQELGYKELELLNKTDCKWLVECWGEPKAHTRLNIIYRSLWDAWREKIQQQKDIEYIRACEAFGEGDWARKFVAANKELAKQPLQNPIPDTIEQAWADFTKNVTKLTEINRKNR